MQLPFHGPLSFGRAGMVAQWYDLQLDRHAGDPGSTRNPALGKQLSRDYPIDVPATPTLPDAELRYLEALDWCKWAKGGCSFLLSAQVWSSCRRPEGPAVDSGAINDRLGCIAIIVMTRTLIPLPLMDFGATLPPRARPPGCIFIAALTPSTPFFLSILSTLLCLLSFLSSLAFLRSRLIWIVPPRPPFLSLFD